MLLRMAEIPETCSSRSTVGECRGLGLSVDSVRGRVPECAGRRPGSHSVCHSAARPELRGGCAPSVVGARAYGFGPIKDTATSEVVAVLDVVRPPQADSSIPTRSRRYPRDRHEAPDDLTGARFTFQKRGPLMKLMAPSVCGSRCFAVGASTSARPGASIGPGGRNQRCIQTCLILARRTRASSPRRSRVRCDRDRADAAEDRAQVGIPEIASTSRRPRRPRSPLR